MTQKEALDILKMGHNVFLTGSAGSGKTFLLNQYVDYLRKKKVKVGITASTGIAATHMNGVTIHSWSGMGIKDSLTDYDMQKLLKKRHLKKNFKKTKVLVIDEISMLHHFQLDMIDKICRAFRQKNEPFGGMQVILCGDFFQLPPVNRRGDEVCFATESDIWPNMDLKVCYLREQHRHGDDELTKILNDIRAGSVGEHTLKLLKKRYSGSVETGNLTKLYTHNVDVDAINNGELQKLEGGHIVYAMTSRGNPKLAEVLKKNCLAPEQLALKKGALVMFVKNSFEEDYVNGTLGRVIGFNKEGLPIVKTNKDRIIHVDRKSWMIEEEGKAIVEINQVPLRLAWAITVHKSQGMTLDAAEIDLSKSFVEGMGYVALSRVRSLDGLKLVGLNDMALRVNEAVLELDKELVKMSEDARQNLNKLITRKKEKRWEEFLPPLTGQTSDTEDNLSTYEKTRRLVEEKLSIKKIAEKRGLKPVTILGHLEKLVKQDKNLDLSYLRPSDSRFKKIEAAFKNSGDLKLTPVREILGDNYSFDELRLARLFLDKYLPN